MTAVVATPSLANVPIAATLAGLSGEERDVLAVMHAEGYDAARTRFGWSRGRIYHLALRTGMRKHEARIVERRAEREARQRETLEALLNRTATADVLDFLDGLPTECAQATITSPPYRLGKKYGEGPSGDTMRAVFYHGWLMQIVSELARITREGGVVCLQVGQTRDWQEQLMPLDVLLFEDLRRAGLTYQSRIVWTIPHGLTPSTRLAERYETVLVFSKGPTPTFNPTAARVPQKQPGKRAFKGPNKGQLSGHPLGAWPSNVWSDLGNVGHNAPDALAGRHPAPFPLKLAKRLALLYSLPGDLVVDPFSGSGTTQVACIETGRAFVGADLFYDDLRARRLAAATPDTRSPLPGVTDESVAVWQAEARRVDTPAEPGANDEALVLSLF